MDEITLAPERLNALLERFYTNGYQAAVGELRERVAELESQVRAQDEAWTVWRQLEGRCDAQTSSSGSLRDDGAGCRGPAAPPPAARPVCWTAMRQLASSGAK